MNLILISMIIFFRKEKKVKNTEQIEQIEKITKKMIEIMKEIEKKSSFEKMK